MCISSKDYIERSAYKEAFEEAERLSIACALRAIEEAGVEDRSGNSLLKVYDEVFCKEFNRVFPGLYKSEYRREWADMHGE